MFETICCQPLLDRLTHVLIKTKQIKKFAQLNTIENKIKFCLSSNVKYDDSTLINIKKEVDDLIELFYSMSPKHEKSFEIADTLKAKGSKAFMKKKDADAFKYYTEGLIHAPHGSPIVALLYANRSATHIQRKRFEDCLIDIERAERAGYPPNAKSKLYKRKLEALLKLGKKEEANIAYQNVVESLPAADADSYSKALKELDKQMSAMSTENTAVRENKTGDDPDLFKQDGTKAMSGALKIRISDIDGRYIEATSDIPKGSTLFKEKPFASILLPEYFSTHCQNCFQRLKNPVPCSNCSDVLWCGKFCREEGEAFHKYECGNLHILTCVGIAHLSLRIVLLAGWIVCKKVRNELRSLTEESVSQLFHSNDKTSRYKSVYSLITHFDKASSDDQFQYCLAGIILAKVITEKSGFLSHEGDSLSHSSFSGTDDEITLAAILVHHISQLVSNAHAITQIEGSALENSAVSLTSQKRIATAIYPLASLMNHSCKPSIINSFDGDVLIINSIKDIRCGDELFNCYGPHASRQTRRDRQSALERQYYFHCQCEACTDDRLLIKEASWSGLKCPSCQGVAEMKEEQNMALETKLFKCFSCQMSGVLPQDIIEKCSQVNNFYDNGQELFQRSRQKEAEKELTKALNVGNQIYTEDNEFLNTIRDDLAKCFVSLEKFQDSLDLLRLCIKTVESRYGEESIEVSHELLKYIDILNIQAAKTSLNKEVEETKQRIKAIFTMHYGAQWNKYLGLYEI